MTSRIYLDTSTIISYLNSEGRRGNVMKTALESAASNSSFLLYTSVASIAEVVHILEANRVRPESGPTIDMFWDTAPITKVEINEISARECRSLTRFRYFGNGNRAKTDVSKRYTIDAIHLAVARWLQCDELWTYDPKHFQAFNEPPELAIREPHMDQLMLEGI
ncbi:MAG: type II toxin-antitoxin system VapC family toxin [Thermomicrobiales bacterium]|nr:type II toxin-antitoxin system VapC family toxin [Thermomicrobiales bacterium]